MRWARSCLEIYDETELKWTQLGQDIDGEAGGDRSGFSVSLSSDGKIVAIGAMGNGATGHVRVWKYDETELKWTQLGQDIDREANLDQSGFSVSLSSDGKTVAIGASGNDGNGYDAGHVRVWKYDETGLKWTQLGQDIDREANLDQSGFSVSLSSDGKIVAIGAMGNGVSSGHVRIFTSSAPTFSALLTMILILGTFVFGLIM